MESVRKAQWPVPPEHLRGYVSAACIARFLHVWRELKKIEKICETAFRHEETVLNSFRTVMSLSLLKYKLAIRQLQADISQYNDVFTMYDELFQTPPSESRIAVLKWKFDKIISIMDKAQATIRQLYRLKCLLERLRRELKMLLPMIPIEYMKEIIADWCQIIKNHLCQYI